MINGSDLSGVMQEDSSENTELSILNSQLSTLLNAACESVLRLLSAQPKDPTPPSPQRGALSPFQGRHQQGVKTQDSPRRGTGSVNLTKTFAKGGFPP